MNGRMAVPLLPNLPAQIERLPAASAFNRRVLDALAALNVVTQAFLVVLIFMGAQGASVLPVAGGATVAMFLLAYFYARWLVPVLDRRHVLAVLLIKEVAVIAWLGLAAGTVWLLSLVF